MKLELTREEIIAVLNIMAKQPFEQVAALIMKIQEQIKEQK